MLDDGEWNSLGLYTAGVALLATSRPTPSLLGGLTMATYVIGDVQGCRASLEALLAKLHFRPSSRGGTDRLWLVGDLVNRGPDSLGVLRLVRDLGPSATVVLGNHDLHLLARSRGLAVAKPRDTLDEVLAAPGRDDLLAWLAARPLLYEEQGWTMVHAGLHPAWTLVKARSEARRLETLLRTPASWGDLIGAKGFDEALKVLTTIRTVDESGRLCKFDGPPAAAPAGCLPWFSHPARQTRGTPIIFGHWAALGHVVGSDYVALDSGCVWGQALTAYRLEDGQVTRVAACG